MLRPGARRQLSAIVATRYGYDPGMVEQGHGSDLSVVARGGHDDRPLLKGAIVSNVKLWRIQEVGGGQTQAQVDDLGSSVQGFVNGRRQFPRGDFRARRTAGNGFAKDGSVE